MVDGGMSGTFEEQITSRESSECLASMNFGRISALKEYRIKLDGEVLGGDGGGQVSTVQEDVCGDYLP